MKLEQGIEDARKALRRSQEVPMDQVAAYALQSCAVSLAVIAQVLAQSVVYVKDSDRV